MTSHEPPAPSSSRGAPPPSTFASLVENAAEGFLVVDRDGIVRYANPAAERLFATPADALVGSLFGFPVHDGLASEIDLLPGAGAKVASMRVTELQWQGLDAHLVSLREALPPSDGVLETSASRLDFLVRCGDVLVGELDAAALLDAFFTQTVPRFADWCVVWDRSRMDADGRSALEIFAARHVDRQMEAGLDALRSGYREGVETSVGFGPSRALRGHMVLQSLDDFGDGADPLPASLRALLARWGYASAIHVPLARGGDDPRRSVDGSPDPTARRVSTGVLSFGLAPSRRGGLTGSRYDPSDLTLAADLARRLALSLENCELYAEAQEAVRLRETFLTTVSHELRTPIQATLSWIEILRRAVADDSLSRPELVGEVQKGLDVVRRNAIAQSHLVEDILDRSRVVQRTLRLDISPLDLREVLDDVVAALRPRASRDGIRLELRTEPLPTIAGAQDRLRQVFSNLLTNALKFSSRGDRVEVSAHVLDRSAEGVGSGDRATVEVRVRDEGRGIAPEMLPRIFEPFRQVDDSGTRGSGLGLGLSIVHNLVALHGGSVSAESEGLGHGATFTVRLPVLPDLEGDALHSDSRQNDAPAISSTAPERRVVSSPSPDLLEGRA